MGKRKVNEEELQLRKEFLGDEEVEDNQEPLEGYWAKVFSHCSILKEELGDNDLEILKHLQSVRKVKEDSEKKDYTLVFTFSENDHFTNTELRKKFIYVGEETDKTEGTEINWKEGKNVTVKKV